MDVLNEELMSLTAASKILPGRPNLATIWRWRTAGVRGVKLTTVLVGGRRLVSRSMLNAFIVEVTAAGDGSAGPCAPLSKDDRAQLAEKSADELGL